MIRAKGLVKRQVLFGVNKGRYMGTIIIFFLYFCLETSLACVAGILKGI